VTDRVLVTGISGFLGGHVALQLLQRGFHVRGSVRDRARATSVRATLARHGTDTARLEIVRLDLTRDAGWTEAMAGVRYLQHVASPLVIDRPRDRNELIRPAVEGTRRALTAAFAAGVERVVLTSSIAAIVYGHADYSRTFTTTDWSEPDSRRTDAYPESKLRAEREAWSIAEAHGARDRLAVINPAAILGPLLDADPGPSGELLLRLLSGAVPLAPRLSFSLVDVRDVAEAHLAAMTAPAAGGHRHILSERELSLLELTAILRRQFPRFARRLPRHEAPDWLVRLAGLFDRRIGEHTGELGNHRRVDGSSGARLLSHPLIPAPEAAVATARSLIGHGLLGRN
jgi:dihydroflavonol-4-reductase